MIEGALHHLPGADASWISASVRARCATDADALTKVLLSGSNRAEHCLSLVSAEGLRITEDGSIEPLERVPA